MLSSCSDTGAGGGESGSAGASTGGSSAGTGNGVGGSGGVAGSSPGGSTGAGGSNASGGNGASGGTVGSGGTAGSGGALSTGGSAGSGGGSGSGGSAGMAGGGVTGGAAGTAGSGNSSGGSAGGGGIAGAGGSSGGSAGSGGDSGAAGSASMPCPPATPLTGGQQYCSNSKGNAGAGYGYELWAEGSGSGCMRVHGMDATFSANWDGVEDFLARVGLDFDRSRTPAQIGTITADFAHTKTGSEDGLTYVGIYGWTVEPLREYYILDDWGTEKPAGVASDGSPRTNVGTLVADGETYDVWMKTRVDKPSIEGDRTTFDQYFSIRRTARQCGRITVSEHFDQWIELGLPLGKLVEAKLLAEAQFNSGTISFTTAKFNVD